MEGEGAAQKMFGLLAARHTEEYQRKLAAGRVAVAGLGGLGSHAALALARLGVGSFLLIDFDRVDESNLHRQCYFSRHVGRLKTEALSELIAEINPFVRTATLAARLTAAKVPDILADWPIIIEALDAAETKAEIVSAALALPHCRVIAASGLAGAGSANDLICRRAAGRLYVCGDGHSEIGPQVSLMAPRVMVCAGHQANMAARLILGFDQP